MGTWTSVPYICISANDIQKAQNSKCRKSIIPARGFASHFPRGSGNRLFALWRQKRSPAYGAVVLIEDQRRIHWLTSGVSAQVRLSLSLSLGEGNQNLPKEDLVLTHVALCGLEETQQTDKIFNRLGSPEEYVQGRTLSIMLMQMILDITIHGYGM